jgi:Cu/Ag efflux pump CusA
VVIGGLFTATLLTLYLLPAAYAWFAPRENTATPLPQEHAFQR